MKTLLVLVSCLLIPASSQKLVANTNTIYFLAEGYDLSLRGINSFVLPLCQPADIAHARYLITNAPSANSHIDSPVPIVKIAAGNDGTNRDYYSPSKREWSWHINEFSGFTDDFIPEASAWPMRIENDVQGWLNYIAHNGGYTVFPFHIVVQELGTNPYWVTVTPGTNSLVLNWGDLGTNYIYTLESKATLPGGNWSPVAGTTWPVQTNQWTLPLPAAASQFYRVRADALAP